MLSRLGVLVFIAATAVMSVALLRARSVSRSDDWTLRSRIEMEIEKLEKQRRLMNRVGYWFLLPMLIANGISLLGGHHARTGSLVPDGAGWPFLPSAACCMDLRIGWFAGKRRGNGTPSWRGCSELRADLLG